MISKTREKARVVSRDASFIEYNQGSKDPLIGNSRAIGGVNIDQSRKGVDYPNVQSAIDDLYTISQLRVGDVLVSTNPTAPEAVGQIETLTFTGAVKNSANPEFQKAVVHVYGIPFVFNKDQTHLDVIGVVLDKFTEMMNNNEIFSNVKRKGDENNELEVQFIDCIEHPATDTNENGIKITGTIDSPARAGYGTWSNMGSEEKFGSTLYYFKRIA